MLPLVSGLRIRYADVAASLLQYCKLSEQYLSQSTHSSGSLPTLWPAQQYSTAQSNADLSAQRAKHADKDTAPKAQLVEAVSVQPAQQRSKHADKDKTPAANVAEAVPVQPTHRILKVVLQSDVPLTSLQLYDKVREEFGKGAFHSRRYFKTHLHRLQQFQWVKATAPRSLAVGSAKAGRKAAAKADNFVYIGTHLATKVDLNEPGSRLQQEARAAANKWTAKNLKVYKQLLQEGRLKPTVDDLALLAPERRPRLFARSKVDGSKTW